VRPVVEALEVNASMMEVGRERIVALMILTKFASQPPMGVEMRVRTGARHEL
jgi:hypothetical protein